LSQGTDTTFIETQFPVSKLSKESYKERKANYSQTLTGLGKWWGRKPLIMVRGAILGLLLPAGPDSKRDREIFLQLLTMDPEGLWRRKTKAIPLAELFARLRPDERADWFDPDAFKPRYCPARPAKPRPASNASSSMTMFDLDGH
jgi:putative DNA methylase